MRDLQIDWLKCFLAVVDNRAVASPIPLEAPVITAIFPLRLCIFTLLNPL